MSAVYCTVIYNIIPLSVTYCPSLVGLSVVHLIGEGRGLKGQRALPRQHPVPLLRDLHRQVVWRPDSHCTTTITTSHMFVHFHWVMQCPITTFNTNRKKNICLCCGGSEYSSSRQTDTHSNITRVLTYKYR